MKYFKSLGFYFCELLGGVCNFLCSLGGYYPTFDWGIAFLLHFEGKRIHVEQQDRSEVRQDKEREANALEAKAKNDG